MRTLTGDTVMARLIPLIQMALPHMAGIPSITTLKTVHVINTDHDSVEQTMCEIEHSLRNAWRSAEYTPTVYSGFTDEELNYLWTTRDTISVIVERTDGKTYVKYDATNITSLHAETALLKYIDICRLLAKGI